MDLVMPAGYRGKETLPGVAVTHTRLSLVGVNLAFIKELKTGVVVEGVAEIGAYSKLTSLRRDYRDLIERIPDGDYLMEVPEETGGVERMVKEAMKIPNRRDVIPSAVFGFNRRSSALTDRLLGFVHGALMTKDSSRHVVIGKQQGFVWENDLTDRTGGPEKYSIVVMRTFPKRLVVHNPRSYSPREVKFKKSPNDVIDDKGVKPFCWFEKFTY